MAIIVPNGHHLRALPGLPANQSLAALCHDKKVRELVLKELNAARKESGFKQMELLRVVVLLPDEGTPESGLVTAAQKVRSQKVANAFDGEIKEVYKHH